MFDSLSEKLENAFRRFRNKGKLTEADVREGMREVRQALLEADVNYLVVKQFVKDNAEKIGAIVNVSTAALIESSYGQMQKLASGAGVKLCEKEFHCRGKFSALHAGHPDEADLKAAREFARSVTA